MKFYAKFISKLIGTAAYASVIYATVMIALGAPADKMPVFDLFQAFIGVSIAIIMATVPLMVGDAIKAKK